MIRKKQISLNLGDCEKKLRVHYKIQNSEKIYIEIEMFEQ